MWRREPRAAALWIAISILAPILGPLFYFIAGINRTQRRARRRMPDRHASAEGLPGCGGEARASAVGDLEPLARLGDQVALEPLVDGNSIEPLWNGEEAYPAMLEALAGAKKTVALCTYIFDCDEVGRKFVDALAAAAERGAHVKLLVDGLGGWWWLSKLGRLLRRRRLKVETFLPLGLFPSRIAHFNLRNHRKILVVDGAVAFSGGMNVSDRHYSGSSRPGRCRDVHFRLKGPLVAQCMRAFADDWRFAAGEILAGPDWFPPPAHAGSVLARGVTSGPDSDLERIYWFIAGACQSARRSIRIVTPYFIPEQGLRHALMAAALRGVQVQLVLPQSGDARVVTWATTAYLWELLKAGISVVRTPPPFDHGKLIVVDERWVLFGSANLDPRSLRLNFEFNVEAFDPALAAALTRQVEGLVRQGRKVTLQEVDSRSIPIRLRDGVAKLFSPYL
ncbi:MAG: PLDc N-terminal domain-containing protein [Planctomycetes bacterium]|nr:PLDc N-terminal domain-containing protein [Planctomycetota bacterium]